MKLINKSQDYNILQYLSKGNTFSFPTSKLIENQRVLSGSKRDMRKKFIKSSRPTYMKNRIVNKAQDGLKLNDYEGVEEMQQEDQMSSSNDVFNTNEFADLDQYESIEDLFNKIYLNHDDTPQQYVSNVINNTSAFNIDAAVEYLNKHAKNISGGMCARAVRQALEQGGLDTTGRPSSAYLYNNFLPKLGFKPILESGYTGNSLPKDYTPQKGDIVVIGANSKHKHGHIAMYNGSQWISDFKQKTFHGLKGANYDNYIIWRHV